MSNTITNGTAVRLTIPSGQSLAVSSISGAFSASIVGGVGSGTVLATSSTDGAVYGPYSTGAIIDLTSSASSVIDYDIGITPVNAFNQTSRYTFDQAGNVNGLVRQDGVALRQLSAVPSQRASRIAAYNSGPMIVAPLRIDSTAYLAGDGYRIADGTHFICTVAGTSGVGAPTAFFDGRAITDGTATFYVSPWKKNLSDADAPTVTASASAGVVTPVALTETKFVNGTAAVQFLTMPDAIPFNRSSGAYMAQVGCAIGNSAYGSANATADVTAGTGFPVAFSGEGYQISQYDAEFYVNDSKFMLVFQNAAQRFQVLIDGRPVFGSLPLQAGSGGSGYVFDFNGVQKNRKITIATVATFLTIRGVGLTPQGSLGVVPKTTDVLLLLGDSFGNTVTPSIADGHLGVYIKRYLGLGGVINASVGGSGYIAFNANSYNIAAMLASPSNKTIFAYLAPTHVFVNAGGNDRGVNTVAQIQVAALSAWQTIRAQFPSAKITITDGYAASGGPDANAIALSAGLLATFTAWADGNSRFVPSIGAGGSASFIWGTGNANVAIVAGNASIYTSTDTVHPSPGGARYLGARFADAISVAWNGDY